MSSTQDSTRKGRVLFAANGKGTSACAQALNPVLCFQDFAEARLRDEYRAVQFFRRHRSRFVAEGERAGRVGEELHRIAEMKSAPGGRVATHLRHVSADRNGIDAVILEPALQLRFRESIGPVFFDQ